MIRPMTSNGSALSSIVANSHQAIHFVSSAPSIHSVRRVFPQYGWKSALSSCALPKPFGASFDAGSAVRPFLAISYPGVRVFEFYMAAASVNLHKTQPLQRRQHLPAGQQGQFHANSTTSCRSSATTWPGAGSRYNAMASRRFWSASSRVLP